MQGSNEIKQILLDKPISELSQWLIDNIDTSLGEDEEVDKPGTPTIYRINEAFNAFFKDLDGIFWDLSAEEKINLVKRLLQTEKDSVDIVYILASSPPLLHIACHLEDNFLSELHENTTLRTDCYTELYEAAKRTEDRTINHTKSYYYWDNWGEHWS